jgi:hypothetical protein
VLSAVEGTLARGISTNSGGLVLHIISFTSQVSEKFWQQKQRKHINTVRARRGQSTTFLVRAKKTLPLPRVAKRKRKRGQSGGGVS